MSPSLSTPTSGFCLNCARQRQADRIECSNCGDVAFNPDALTKRYPLPSPVAYNVDALKHSPDAVERATYQLWQSVSEAPDKMRLSAADLLAIADRPGFLSGLIHRAAVLNDVPRAEFLSMVRFQFLVDRTPRLGRSAPEIGAGVSRAADPIDVLAREVLSGQRSCSVAADMLAHLSSEHVQPALNQAFRDFDYGRKATALDLVKTFLLVLTSEHWYAGKGVAEAAAFSGYLAYDLGLFDLAASFVRISYVLAIEQCDVPTGINLVRNLGMIARASHVPGAFDALAEIYSGPPWPEHNELRAYCADGLIRAIADQQVASSQADSISSVLASHSPEIFIQQATFTSLEDYIYRGQHTKADRILSLAWSVARDSGDDRLKSAVCAYLGQLEKAQGHYSAAAGWLNDAMRYSANAEPLSKMELLDMLITVHTEAGDLTRARDEYAKLTDLAQAHPDSSFRPRLAFLAGLIEMAQGNFGRAIPLFEQALRIIHYLPEINRRGTEQVVRNNLEQCKARVGGKVEGRPSERSAYQSGLSFAHSLMARAQELTATDHSHASRTFVEAAEQFRCAGHKPLEITALLKAGTEALQAKDWVKARDLLAECLNEARQAGFPPDVTEDLASGLLEMAVYALSLVRPDLPTEATVQDKEYTVRVFQYLFAKSGLNDLDDSELKSFLSYPFLRNSLCASCAVNAMLPQSDERALQFADLGIRILRLCNSHDPFFEYALAQGLSNGGRRDEAAILMRSAMRGLKANDHFFEEGAEFLMRSGDSSATAAVRQFAQAALDSEDPALRLRGHWMAGRAAEAVGDWNEAAAAFEQAWMLARSSHTETGGEARAAYAAAHVILFKMGDVDKAQLWLERMRVKDGDAASHDLDNVQAGILALTGHLSEAEELLQRMEKSAEASGDISAALDAQIDLATVGVAGGKLIGQNAVRTIQELHDKCEARGMRAAAVSCLKLLGDVYSLQGKQTEAMGVYRIVSSSPEPLVPPAVRRSIRLMEIQSIGDLSERLTELVKQIGEWEAVPESKQHLIKVYVMCAQLLLRGVQPSPAGSKHLAGLTPPFGPFTAAFECCRRAENLSRESCLSFELPEILYLMGLSLSQTWSAESILSPSGLLLEARRLGEAQMQGIVEPVQLHGLVDLLTRIDRTVLLQASRENNEPNMISAFENIRSLEQNLLGPQSWHGGRSLDASPAVVELARLGAEIGDIRRLMRIVVAGQENMKLQERCTALESEYRSKWVRLDRAGRPSAASRKGAPRPGVASLDVVVCGPTSHVLVTSDGGHHCCQLSWNDDTVRSWSEQVVEDHHSRTFGSWVYTPGSALWNVIGGHAASAEALCININGTIGGLPLHVGLAAASGKPVFYCNGGLPQPRSHGLSAKTAPDIASMADPTGDLPGARFESARLKGLFPRMTAYSGRDVTREAFERVARDARVLHLSCHGEYDRDDPLQTQLVLANGQRVWGPQLIWDVAVRAECVLLGACHSGTSGDQLVGGALPWLFIHAGARSVAASLWAVPDLAAAFLLPDLCSELLGGMAPAAALDRAWKALRELTLDDARLAILRAAISDQDKSELIDDLALCGGSKPFENPFYWAAFAMFGDAWF